MTVTSRSLARRGLVITVAAVLTTVTTIASPQTIWASEVPSKPTGVAGNQQVELTFDQPTLPPGSATTDGWTRLNYSVSIFDADDNALNDPVTCAHSESSSEQTCVITALSTGVDLVNGTTYKFRVAARWQNPSDVEVPSELSDFSDPLTPFGAPDSPSSLVVEYDTGDPATTAKVSWTRPDNNGATITRYQVYVYDSAGSTRVGPNGVADGGGDDTDDSDGCESSSAATVTCDVTGLALSTTYTFKALAENDGGTSAESTASAAFVTPPSPPSISAITNVASTGDISVTWTAVTGATEYTVSLFDGSTEIDTSVVSGVLTTTFDYVDSSLEYGTQYTAKVAAQNTSTFSGNTDGAGYGARSAASSGVVSSTTPATPSVPTAQAGSGQATVTWTAPDSRGSAIQSYLVQAYQSGVAVDGATCSGSAGDLECDVTDLDTQAYTFTVVASNANGASEASQASDPVTPTAALAAQTITVTSSPSGSVDTSAGTTTISATALGGATITFASTTPSVCTVGSPTSGVVTLVAAGTCTISLTTDATSSHEAGSSSVSFTVTTPTVSPDPEPEPEPDPDIDEDTDQSGEQEPETDGGDEEGASTDADPDEAQPPTNPEAPTSEVVASLPVTTVTLGGDASDSSSEIALGSQISLEFPAGTFDPLEWVVLSIHSSPVVLGSFLSDAAGGLTASVSVPDSVETGNHTLVGIGQTSERGARSVVSVVVSANVTFESLTPARILDTRGSDPVGELDGSGDAYVLQVTGVGGVPSSGVSAVALNVTVVDGEANDFGGFVTVFPCGTRPDASNLNFVSGQTVPNSVIAPLSADGEVCLYVYGVADLLVDVSGYFVSGFEPLTPDRILDTRGSDPVGELDGSGDAYTLQVTGSTVPESATAVALNVTVVDGEANDFGGFVTVFPCGTRPDASNLNFVSGQTVPNSVIAPLSATGTVCLYVYGQADLLVDVSGYFTSGFTPQVPDRILDTRGGDPVGELDGTGDAYTVQVTGGDVPESATAVALNVTVVDGQANDFGGFVTGYPCGTRPDASNLNFISGQTVPNSVIAPLSAIGTVCLYVYGQADLLVDVSGHL